MSCIQTTQIDVPADVINLGIGQPSLSLLPLDLMKQAANHRLNQGDPSLLQYGAMQGDGYFRLALAQFLSKAYGTPVETDHLFITAGSSQGLDLICTFFTKPGDTVFVEEPSYFLALHIFADRHLKVVSIPTDEDGLIIEALEEKLAEHRPAFLYTVPVFHNPSGITLSASRRERLVALSEAYDFLIVADEVYQLLNYTTSPPPPMGSYGSGHSVLSLGSFSKILAPGLRLGWLQADPSRLDRFVRSGLLDSGGGLNPFTSGLVRSALELGLQQEHLAHLKRVYTERSAVLSEALHQYLPDSVTFTEPAGGFFIWLRLPHEIDAAELLQTAQKHNVAFHPGRRFSSQQGLQNCLRLSFCFYEEAQLVEGVKRLGQALDSHNLS